MDIHCSEPMSWDFRYFLIVHVSASTLLNQQIFTPINNQKNNFKGWKSEHLTVAGESKSPATGDIVIPPPKKIYSN